MQKNTPALDKAHNCDILAVAPFLATVPGGAMRKKPVYNTSALSGFDKTNITPEVARRILAAMLLQAIQDLPKPGSVATESRKWLQGPGICVAIFLGVEEKIQDTLLRAKGFYQASLFEVDE